MKLVRIASADGPQWGAIEADAVRLLRGDPQQGFTPTAKTRAFDPQLLLAPVQPSKIVALAASYPKHAAEMGHAVAPVVAGDVVEVEIEGIGVLRNPVLNRVDRP